MMFQLKFARRLGGRIFLTFALALILLSMFFSLFTTHFGGELVTRSSANELRLLSVVLSELIQNQFSSLEGSLESISEDETLLRQMSDKVIQRPWIESFLRASLARNPHLTDIMVYDLEGHCVGSTDPDWYGIRGKSWKFFEQGLHGFNFPSIYETEVLGRVQLVSAPIMKDRRAVGLVLAIINLDDIYELMDQKIGLSETTDAFLLDRDLRFITAGRLGEKGLVESHLVSTTMASHLNDEFWVGEYLSSDSNKVLGTALKIPGYSWYVVVERDYDDVLKQLTSLRRAVLVTTLVLLVIFIIGSLALSRSITRPLMQLVQSTRQIAAGKYHEPVLVNHEIEEIAYIGTELERMRKKVAQSQDRLKERLSESEQLRIESERLASIGSLAASLAHEIRNPLNAMSLLLSRMQYSTQPETRNHIVGDLFGEIGRLDRLVSSILDYARPVALDRKWINVHSVLVSVVDLFRSLADSKHVLMRVEGDPQLMAHLDPDKLKQCIVNLVKNSLDALDGGGHIALTCLELDQDIVIEVFDSGSGILPDIRSKLFTPFFTTKEQGTGLGLSVVHKIIAAHGGRIEIVSSQDHASNSNVTASTGTKFAIHIPISSHM